MCNNSSELPYSIYINSEQKVFLDLPKHCRNANPYFEGFGPYGLEYSCPFQGKEYQIIVGKEHPEIKFHEGMFKGISDDAKLTYISDIHKRDSTATDFEFGKHYDLYTFSNGSGRSIYYKKMIRIPNSNDLISLIVRKRSGGTKLPTDIMEIKRLGSSFKF